MNLFFAKNIIIRGKVAIGTNGDSQINFDGIQLGMVQQGNWIDPKEE
jgi:hypothetical protein